MPECPPRGVTGPRISLSGKLSPESAVITNCPSGIFMSAAHLDSMDWAKAIASLRSVMHAINIGGGAGASVETPYGPLFNATAHNAVDPPPRRLARPSARRADAGGLRDSYGAPVRPRHHHAEPGAAGDQGRRGRLVPRTNPQSGSGRAQVRALDDLLP